MTKQSDELTRRMKEFSEKVLQDVNDHLLAEAKKIANERGVPVEVTIKQMQGNRVIMVYPDEVRD